MVLEDLTAALTRAIEELTRPVDAIKHQAKTVTVGISRSDETLLQVAARAGGLAAGAPRDRLSYRTLRTLADLDPAVAEVTGLTRYRIEGRSRARRRRHASSSSTGAASPPGFPSRTDRDPRLRGTKNRVATEREVIVARGRSDGRTARARPGDEGRPDHRHHAAARAVPPTGCPPATARGRARRGTADRYAALRDAVTETEPTFREDLLAEIPVVDLLTIPITDLADRWRAAPAREPRWSSGIGTDLVDLDRFRRGPRPHARPRHAALLRRTSRPTPSAEATRPSATRPVSRPRRP